jgi:hypothetical protein
MLTEGDVILGNEELMTDIGTGRNGPESSTDRLYAEYPSHNLPDRKHFWHWGCVSSHFTRRFLQLLHPDLIFGRDSRMAFDGFDGAEYENGSTVVDDVYLRGAEDRAVGTGGSDKESLEPSGFAVGTVYGGKYFKILSFDSEGSSGFTIGALWVDIVDNLHVSGKCFVESVSELFSTLPKDSGASLGNIIGDLTAPRKNTAWFCGM